MEHESKIVDNKIVLYLDSSIYSRDALVKCLYWYADRFKIDMDKDKGRYYEVELKPLPALNLHDEELEKVFLKLKQDIMDFNLRDLVTKETKNIRELLIAKAFSNFDTEEPPPDGETCD